MGNCKHCGEPLLPKAFDETVHPLCIEFYMAKLEDENNDLRAACQQKQEIIDSFTQVSAMRAVENNELRAENKRLRSIAEARRKQGRKAREKYWEKEAEVERLREQKTGLYNEAEKLRTEVSAYRGVEQENQRLREALGKVQQTYGSSAARKIARQALEEGE